MSSPNWWGDWRPNLPAHSGNLQATDLIECTSIVGGLPVNTAITGQQIINAASGGGATWGSITGTLSSQTDLQTALNAKQATLVSGTNIKTVNSTSLLGSGDIAVQPTLVSGTNIKTVNGNSLLGSGDVTISGGGNVGVHAIMPLASGQSCGALLNSFSLTTTATIVNRLYAYPFIPNQNITTSGMYINVTTAVASALSRILIYSNVNGLPNTKLYESANLDCSTTGVKTATTTFNFVAGTTYWLAFYSNSTSTINFINTTNLLPININTTNINVYAWSGATFGSAPTTFNPSPNFSTTVAPYIGITKA